METIQSILLIEDDTALASGFKQLLERQGFEVRVANGGRTGLKLFEQAPADLVVTDIFMEDMEGLETIVALRRRYADLRVIAVSGGSRTVNLDCLEMAAALGANRTLRKPVTIEQLLETIRELGGKPEQAG